MTKEEPYATTAHTTSRTDHCCAHDKGDDAFNARDFDAVDAVHIQT